MSGRPAGPVLAAGLFSVVPMPAATELTSTDARRALLWLPVLGVAIGSVAGLVGAAFLAATGAGLLAAVLAVVTMQALVGAMHLDGLADSADGLAALGSRKAGRDAAKALEIMRAPDTGAMGVAAIAGVLLVDAAALAASPDGPTMLVLAALATAAGRLAVLVACRRGVPAARPDGFGALFAQAAPLPGVIAAVAAAIVLAALGGWWLGGWQAALALAVSLLVAQGVALVASGGWVRTFGGLTGDLFGALVELTTAAFLVCGVLLLAIG